MQNYFFLAIFRKFLLIFLAFKGLKYKFINFSIKSDNPKYKSKFFCNISLQKLHFLPSINYFSVSPSELWTFTISKSIK